MLLSLLLMGCGPDEALDAQIEELEDEVSELTLRLERTERERDALKNRVSTLQERVDAQKLQEMLTALGLERGQALGAVLETTQGTITCELWPEHAPITVTNFVQLAEGTKEWEDPATGAKVTRKLYDGTIFHRVIPGFMIQGGDPLGKGTGGPGYKFQDEVDAGLTFDKPGLLAMANAGPGTNGSQFFITLGEPGHLNGKHTIFGDCEPLETVEAIAAVERGPRDKPVVPQVLKRVTITRG